MEAFSKADGWSAHGSRSSSKVSPEPEPDGSKSRVADLQVPEWDDPEDGQRNSGGADPAVYDLARLSAKDQGSDEDDSFREARRDLHALSKSDGFWQTAKVGVINVRRRQGITRTHALPSLYFLPCRARRRSARPAARALPLRSG